MSQNGSLRLATFNIKHGALADGDRGNPEQVAEACAALQADILALQEVDQGVARSKYADLAALAAKAAGMEVVFAQTMRCGGGRFGNALLVRGAIDNAEVVRLPRGYRFWERGSQPRNAILATTRVGGRQISVVATHLSPPQWISEKQLRKAAAAIMARPQPRVLMGDFNRSRAQVLAHGSVNELMVSDGPPTFPALEPEHSIDHIAVSGLTICRLEAVRFPFSDHRALIADVE